MTFHAPAIVRSSIRHGFTRPVRRYEEDDLLDPHEAWNVECCNKIYEILFAAYPGHPWVIQADYAQGIAKVQLEGFTTWWFVINFRDTPTYNAFVHMVKRAGGEFLERYQIPRTGFTLDNWVRAHDAFETHVNRNRIAS